MQLIKDLGDTLERRWVDTSYNEDAFPRIAAEALAEADLPARLSCWDAVEWALGQTNLPQQRDLPSRFGEPPITLYNSARFYIDLYFWFSGTTAVHQHSFCGAFQVLHGSSLHSHYTFEPRDRVNDYTEIGDLRLESSTILEVGDTHEIAAGRSYIHSLFHLDHPSATLVVRNLGSPRHQPQYSYFKPYLALDPFYEEPNTVKKLQCLAALFRDQHDEAERLACGWLEAADFQTTFRILDQLRSLLQADPVKQMFHVSDAEERFTRFLEMARTRHGDRARVLEAVFEEQSRIGKLVQQRSYVTEPDHRFFLALAMTVDDRETLLSLVRQRFPDADPMETVLDWITDLSQTRVVGAGKANALGIADFDTADILVLEHLVQDRQADEIRAALGEEHSGPGVEGFLETLEVRIERLRGAGIFKPLFEGAH